MEDGLLFLARPRNAMKVAGVSFGRDIAAALPAPCSILMRIKHGAESPQPSIRLLQVFCVGLLLEHPLIVRCARTGHIPKLIRESQACVSERLGFQPSALT